MKEKSGNVESKQTEASATVVPNLFWFAAPLVSNEDILRQP